MSKFNAIKGPQLLKEEEINRKELTVKFDVVTDVTVMRVAVGAMF